MEMRYCIPVFDFMFGSPRSLSYKRFHYLATCVTGNDCKLLPCFSSGLCFDEYPHSSNILRDMGT